MIGTKILEEQQSKYNGTLRVVKTWGMGTYIQSNGLTQSGGIVETIWKSTLKEIVNCKLKIDNCLILGLGGGTVAKLVRKNWPDAKITGMDIDPIMIELGKKYLGLDDQNVEIKIQDAYKFSEKLKAKSEKFDLIIVDLYNGDQFPKKFETSEFIEFTRWHLVKNGAVIFNKLYYGDKKEEASRFGKKIENIFPKVVQFHPVSNLMFICYNK